MTVELSTSAMETETGLRVLLRMPLPGDIQFVRHATLREARRELPGLSAAVLEMTIVPEIERLWETSALAAVAASPDDPEFIMGFVCGDPAVPLLHMCHVKGGFRGQRLATLLLSLLGIDRSTPAAVTFATRDMRRAVRKGSWPNLRVA